MLLTPHRHLSEVMLREIGHIPGPELEFADDREAYSLSAGIALGMITLGVSPSHQYTLIHTVLMLKLVVIVPVCVESKN